ncbi:MAG TPA: hypothetical protein VKZ46_02625 [Pedomonas sp.]|nr:hypothetical protein [Pedomonas sp.]
MTRLRAFFSTRPWLAVWLVAAALLMKVMVPAGFMTSMNGGGLSVQLCTAYGVQTVVLTPDGQIKSTDASPTEGAMEAPCAFAGHGAPLLSGASPALLAVAIAFILATSLRPVKTAPQLQPFFLRPPAIGPPLTI